MPTLRAFLDGVADELGDFVCDMPQMSYQQWSQCLLLSFINEGLAVIATYKPQNFVKPFIYKLTSGVTQQPLYKVIGTITEQVDAAGNHIGFIRASQGSTVLRWSKPACNINPADYRVTMVYSAAKSSSSFDVSPPVPAGADVYVKLQAVMPPAELTEANMSDQVAENQYLAPLRQWVLFRALADSRDSTAEQGEAWKHEKSFYTLLGVQYKMEQTLKASEVAGGYSKP